MINFNTFKNYKSDFYFLSWFARFSDAECLFYIKPLKNVKGIITSFTFRFAIKLHKDDKKVLDYINKKLGVGQVYLRNENAEYVIEKFSNIKNVIIPIFIKNKLYSNKWLDFLDFYKAKELYKKSLNSLPVQKTKLIYKILKLKLGMITGRKLLKFKFNEPYKLETNIIIPEHNLHWIIGFIEGDGSFYLKNLKPGFSINQKYISLLVLKAIEDFFMKLPNNYKLTINSPNQFSNKSFNKKTKCIIFSWSNLDTLHDYLLPFFEKYSNVFLTRKKEDF